MNNFSRPGRQPSKFIWERISDILEGDNSKIENWDINDILSKDNVGIPLYNDIVHKNAQGGKIKREKLITGLPRFCPCLCY